MKIYWLTLLLGLSIILGINLYKDPDKAWTRRYYNFSSNWTQSQAWITPKGYDERSCVASHLRNITQINTLVLGSSRAMLVDSSILSDQIPMFNAGVSGATFEDFMAIWQLLKDSNKIPKQVILFFDPWVLNKNNGQIRWMSWSDKYFRFNEQTGFYKSSLVLWKEYWTLVILPFLRIAGNLVSYSNLEASISSWSESDDVQISEISNFPAERGGRRFDGGLIYPQEYSKNKSVSEVKEFTEKAIKDGLYCLDNFSYNEQVLSQLKQLLNDLRLHWVQVRIITPPFEKSIYETMALDERYKEIIPAVDKAMLEIAKEFPDVKYCRALNPTDIGCEKTEWLDAFHTQQSCNKKIISYCFNQN